MHCSRNIKIQRYAVIHICDLSSESGESTAGSKEPHIYLDYISIRHFSIGSVSNRGRSEGFCYLGSWLHVVTMGPSQYKDVLQVYGILLWRLDNLITVFFMCETISFIETRHIWPTLFTSGMAILDIHTVLYNAWKCQVVLGVNTHCWQFASDLPVVVI